MEHTYKELKLKTAAQLKEIASGIEHEAVKGYTQLNKDHLLKAICEALHIDMFEHHKVVGLNKLNVKGRIRQLKKERDEALTAKDMETVRRVRHQIKKLKNRLRKATV